MLFLIGKAKMPRSFGRRLPAGVRWRSNKMAWMTSEVFGQCVRDFDAIVIFEGKHVALLLDNAPCHPNMHLTNVKLVFLPANTTTGTHPSDAGII